MKQKDGTIFIVEDDHAVRDSLGLLLGLKGYSTQMFADAESFLDSVQSYWRGCMLLDIKMPGMDGLTLQKHLREKGVKISIIIMSGHGTIESAREAFRADAIDFLEKPIDQTRLLTAINEALEVVSETQQRERARNEFSRMLDSLSPREHEVMQHVVAGRHNKEIAEALGISPRTVEVHKSHLLDKLGVSGTSELIRFYVSYSGG